MQENNPEFQLEGLPGQNPSLYRVEGLLYKARGRRWCGGIVANALEVRAIVI